MDKKPKHTPGPWKVEAINRTGRYNVEIGELISTDEALLNAKLIAAAPEMLEALDYTNKALKLLENRIKELQGLPLEVSIEDKDKTLFEANLKLIAKARGESW